MNYFIKASNSFCGREQELIDDSSTVTGKTWSSEKIQDELDEVVAWTALGGFSQNQSCSLPEGWKELLLNAYIVVDDRLACYTFRVAHDTVTSSTGTQIHSFYNGYGYTSSDYGGARVDVSEKICRLNWFRWVGSDYSNQAKMTVRYR